MISANVSSYPENYYSETDNNIESKKIISEVIEIKNKELYMEKEIKSIDLRSTEWIENNLPHPFPAKTIKLESKGTFIELQKWIGEITVIRENSFIATMTDLNNPNNKEVFEFDIDYISEDDLSLYDIGAQFYYNMGRYKSYSTGQISYRDFIRFRRIPQSTFIRNESEKNDEIRKMKEFLSGG